MDSTGVESMAYIPHGNKYGGKLIIASEGMAVYSMPSPLYTDTEDTGSMIKPIKPIESINKRMICRGLAETCKTAAMQFFEGHLYILHDIDRVIRKWDLDSGEMKAEYTLPWVDGGSEKQWKGMALVRKESTNESDSDISARVLRKEKTQQPSLNLYLSLEAPAQIWLIAITEENGVWETPPCVAGS